MESSSRFIIFRSTIYNSLKLQKLYNRELVSTVINFLIPPYSHPGHSIRILKLGYLSLIYFTSIVLAAKILRVPFEEKLQKISCILYLQAMHRFGISFRNFEENLHSENFDKLQISNLFPNSNCI